MGFDKAEQRMKVSFDFYLNIVQRQMKAFNLCHVLFPAGLDGETGQPSLWRWIRESEEFVSQTVAVSCDGEAGNIIKGKMNDCVEDFGEC